MSGPVNRATFERLIAEDIAWCEQQPRTLEREHTIAVLRDAPRLMYEAHPVPPVVADYEGQASP